MSLCFSMVLYWLVLCSCSRLLVYLCSCYWSSCCSGVYFEGLVVGRIGTVCVGFDDVDFILEGVGFKVLIVFCG